MARKMTDEKYRERLRNERPNIINLEPYLDVRTKILHKCLLCGKVFKMKPATMLYKGHFCYGIKYTYEFVYEEFMRRGYVLLDIKYKNTTTKMAYRCNNHSDVIQFMSYHDLRSGCKCKFCAKKNLRTKKEGGYSPSEYTINMFKKQQCEIIRTYMGNSNGVIEFRCSKHPNEIQHTSCTNKECLCKFCREELRLEEKLQIAKRDFSNRGYELLETKYISNTTKMRYRCPKHPDKILYISHYCIKVGQGCPYCAKVAKPNFEDVVKEFDDRGCDLLSEEYINNRTKLEYICRKHIHESQFITWNDFHNNGYGCRFCGTERTAESLKLDIDIVKNGFIKSKKIPIFTEYKNIGTPLPYRCIYHPEYIQYMSYDNVKAGGMCPLCSESKGERKVRIFLEKNNIDFIQYYKINDCRNIRALEFDFAVFKSSNILFLCEYDGMGHHKPIDFAGKGWEWAKENFNGIRHRDNIKDKYCVKNNIKLVRIPYWEFDNIENILTKELKTGGINIG